jgi:hypothetical protein
MVDIIARMFFEKKIMRRFFLLMIVVGMMGLACALGSAARSVDAAPEMSYGPDVSTTGQAYSCGDYAGYPDTYAFDDSLVSGEWRSAQYGTGVMYVSCIGQHFSGPYDVRQISIQQIGAHNNRVSGALWQYSDDGTNWHSVTSLTLPDDTSKHVYSALPVSGLHSWWRLLAGSNTYGSVTWGMIEIEMMEEVGSPPVTSVPTATAPSSTPTITLTPSTTPSPTPDIGVIITSTSGPAMRFERSANIGDLGICAGELLLGGLGLIVFAISYWKRAYSAN